MLKIYNYLKSPLKELNNNYKINVKKNKINKINKNNKYKI